MREQKFKSIHYHPSTMSIIIEAIGLKIYWLVLVDVGAI
jgi:hypothetical protein